MTQVNWVKCGTGNWCRLDKLDLSSITAPSGVYIIWHGGNPSRVVRLGQGDIAKRLGVHRNDPKVTAYSQYGQLYVTWAAVGARQVDGVERYLADTWHPLVGAAFPDVPAIAVNSPWS